MHTVCFLSYKVKNHYVVKNQGSNYNWEERVITKRRVGGGFRDVGSILFLDFCGFHWCIHFLVTLRVVYLLFVNFSESMSYNNLKT